MDERELLAAVLADFDRELAEAMKGRDAPEKQANALREEVRRILHQEEPE